MYPDPTGPKVGDPIPNFALPDTTGTLCFGRSPQVAGQMAVMLFVGDVHSPAAEAELAACRELAPSFTEAGVVLMAVTGADPDANLAAVQPPDALLVLGDMEGKALEAFGVGKASDRALPVGFVINRNSFVAAVLPGGDTPLAARALEEVQRAEHRPAGAELRHVAPVLEIPRVFEPEFCEELISAWRLDSKETGTDQIDAASSDGVDVIKIRRDHIVRDSDLAKGIQRRQALRILPEIEKVFFFRVTCQEAVRIGRYDSAREAFFGPHRDNIPPNTHRRFALTLNLNDGYTGGALRFPEYGPHLYRPPIGGAIVFPCSLIHEALPVTAGDRFAAITFYFGDAEREAYKAKHAAQSQGA